MRRLSRTRENRRVKDVGASWNDGDMRSRAALTSVPAAQASARKARGAFFTPAPVAEFMVRWAVRDPLDRIMDPSCGDAAFLLPATARIAELIMAVPDSSKADANRPSGEYASAENHRPTGNPGPADAVVSRSDPAESAPSPSPQEWAKMSAPIATRIVHPTIVHGVDIHEPTAREAEQAIARAGGAAKIIIDDFFNLPPEPVYDAVIGNPPYIRYQGFRGTARARAQEAALRAGVSLTALASSWAAFVIHASQFLRPGGRMGFVLPAELLSVNYAGPVRRFLFENFGSVELVLFERQIFPDAEADVVLLMADRFGERTDSATIRQVPDAAHLDDDVLPLRWAPPDPTAKWTGILVEPDTQALLSRLLSHGTFTPLSYWGDTKLGAVTGGNKYFTLSPSRVRELGLTKRDLVRVSPPGSGHLRGLELSSAGLASLSRSGKSTWLFHPGKPLSRAAAAYVQAGHKAGVDQAYKCRVRSPWYTVPLLPIPDLLLTCMNADTPRLTTNSARVHHLNSIHGVYLTGACTELGRELLPLASLNSVTLLSAEITGRSYGGGILKLEPREAGTWMMPSPTLVGERAAELRGVRGFVATKLAQGKLLEAVASVDDVLFGAEDSLSTTELKAIRVTRENIANRRMRRGRKNGR